jgi:hypothetical protein
MTSYLLPSGSMGLRFRSSMRQMDIEDTGFDLVVRQLLTNPEIVTRFNCFDRRRSKPQ